MEPDMKERREFIYIPSHIVFHPANEATPGVMKMNHFHFQYTPLHLHFQYNVLVCMSQCLCCHCRRFRSGTLILSQHRE